MGKKRVPVEDEVTTSTQEAETGGNGSDGEAVADGYLLDYITGNKVKENGKELVRQRIARALFHAYHIPAEYMERDHPVKVKVGERNQTIKVDVAIFGSARQEGQPRNLTDLRRAVF